MIVATTLACKTSHEMSIRWYFDVVRRKEVPDVAEIFQTEGNAYNCALTGVRS